MKPHELVFALVERGGGASKVARAMGYPGFQGTLHKIAAGRVESPTRESAERISRFFDIPIDALYDSRVAARVLRDKFANVPANEAPPSYVAPSGEGVAQKVSQLSPITLPSLTWEGLMIGSRLPEVFILAAPDDALAPRIRAGDAVIWSTSKPAKLGSPILVRDAAGQVYVRRMYEGQAPGHFIARVKSDAFRALDSVADQLTILAVYAGRLGDFDDS